MRATVLPKAIILTKARRAAVSIMAKGYLSTASEVFLIFTTQLYSYLYNYNPIHVFPYAHKRKVLQQQYSQPPILPSPHFRWVVNILYDLQLFGRSASVTCQSKPPILLTNHAPRGSATPPAGSRRHQSKSPWREHRVLDKVGSKPTYLYLLGVPVLDENGSHN